MNLLKHHFALSLFELNVNEFVGLTAGPAHFLRGVAVALGFAACDAIVVALGTLDSLGFDSPATNQRADLSG